MERRPAKQLERSAVYFPHNHIRNLDFVKHTLLFWDRVYTIVPPDTALRNTSAVPPRVAALEIIRPRYPGEREQYEVQRRLSAVASSPDRGSWLRSTIPGNEMFPYNIEYPIYEKKFSQPTWQLLNELQLVDPGDTADEPLTKPATGLWLMAMLADAMAGDSLATVTDRHGAYAWLEQAIALNKGMSEVSEGAIRDKSDEYEFAARATLPVIGATQFDIDKLIKLREREAAGETWLRTARHNYLDLLSSFPDRVAAASRSGVELEDVYASFSEDCEESFRALEEALQTVNLKAMLNDKVNLPIAVAAGAVGLGTASIGAALGGLGLGVLYGGIKQIMDSRQERQKALTTNRLAWGYLAAGR